MNRRRAARFGAVQALYQAEMSGSSDILPIIAEFQAFRLADLLEPLELEQQPPEVDRTWFNTVTRGAWKQTARLDELIQPRLAADWTMDRIGFLLRAFLRAGAYELLVRKEVPTKVVLNEYTELAHAFLDREEAGFLNAVLDRLAAELREDTAAAARSPSPDA